MRKPNRMLVALVLFIGLGGPAANADSRVYNGTDTQIQIIWNGSGCAAGIKTFCGVNSRPKDAACRKAVIGPGKVATYAFPNGTSRQKVDIALCGATVTNPETGIPTRRDLRRGDDASNAGDNSRCIVTGSKTPGVLDMDCGVTRKAWKAKTGQDSPVDES